ncbi:Nacht domain-containing protein [Fusarium circinatum]|uniref:Nacht domain-containing protein n=1 Tax=Fusarium circinatum TaxID=48490 RepID=A0A8H5U5H2_FUSCI|nr:Nacht domain-containing protein [Fusarium circinatum]
MASLAASTRSYITTVGAVNNDSISNLTTASSTLSTSLLRHRMRLGRYEDWYLGNPRGRWTDPAKKAFESANKILREELSSDDYNQIFLNNYCSIKDVEESLKKAKEKYNNKPEASRIHRWLFNCSERIVYYGSIFDVFVQHHPEYVSLAWGTFKFLFVAVLSYEELLAKISKAVSQIADVLPRTELHAILYPTDRMQEAVSMVYAKIIEFSITAIRWYKKNGFRRVISSIISPFSISFKDIIDEISERSRTVDQLANAANKAETRDVHTDLVGMRERVHQIMEMISMIHASQILQNEIILNLRDRESLCLNSQLEGIRDILMLQYTPLADQSLSHCVSMRNRRKRRAPIQIPTSEVLKLKQWLSDPSSSLLLAQGQGVRTSSSDFAVDFVNAVREKGYPIIWAFPSPIREEEERLSTESILRSLILQALALIPNAVSEGASPLRTQHFRNITSPDEWINILNHCLALIPRVFVVIDMALMQPAVYSQGIDGRSFHLVDFIQRISEMAHARPGGQLKVLIVSWQFEKTTLLDSNEIFGKEQIATDAGRRVDRLMRRPKYKAVVRRRNEDYTKTFKSTMDAVDKY